MKEYTTIYGGFILPTRVQMDREAQQHNNTMTEVAAIIKQGTYPWYLT